MTVFPDVRFAATETAYRTASSPIDSPWNVVVKLKPCKWRLDAQFAAWVCATASFSMSNQSAASIRSKFPNSPMTASVTTAQIFLSQNRRILWIKLLTLYGRFFHCTVPGFALWSLAFISAKWNREFHIGEFITIKMSVIVTRIRLRCTELWSLLWFLQWWVEHFEKEFILKSVQHLQTHVWGSHPLGLSSEFSWKNAENAQNEENRMSKFPN